MTNIQVLLWILTEHFLNQSLRKERRVQNKLEKIKLKLVQTQIASIIFPNTF